MPPGLQELTRNNPDAAVKFLNDYSAQRANQLKVEEARAHAEETRSRCQKFSGFVKEAWSIVEPSTDLKWSWHMDAICDHLEAISRGKLHPRLIINVPPGSSKSLLVSVLWQAWEWGPMGMRGRKFLTCSFEEGNAKRDTRKTRDLILSEWYQALWPEVVLTRRGELSFQNSGTGTREGVAFGSITGKRGDVFAIDDPHSTKGAESEAERVAATRQFIEGGLNRLNDQARSAIVVVMQRLHEADLTGVLLALDIGFVHLMIPMEFETARACQTPLPWHDPRTQEGELMDPVRMPEAEVEKLKRVSQYAFAGQYQQRPAPREGGMFKVERIEIVTHAPPGRRVRGWDIAGSTKKTSPYTVGILLSQANDGRLYIEDCKRVRKGILVAEQTIVETATNDGVYVLQSIPQDPGQSALSQKAHLSQKLAGLNFRFTPETGSKQDRAIPIASQVEAGMVFMVKGDWNHELVEELRNFPAGQFKDQADALSRAYSELVRFREDTIGPPPEIPEPAGDEDDEDEWLDEYA